MKEGEGECEAIIKRQQRKKWKERYVETEGERGRDQEKENYKMKETECKIIRKKNW